MPHKRAKRSIRESDKAKKGSDLPPQTHASGSSSYTDADTPKAGARILNSLKVQAAYHERRKQSSEDLGPNGRKKAGAGKKVATPKILPGETLGQFNRRLEDHLRPAVTAAMKEAAGKVAQEEREVWQAKKARREAEKEKKRVKEAGEGMDVDGEGEGGPVASGSGEGKGKEGGKSGDYMAGKRKRDAKEEEEMKEERVSKRPQKEFAPIPAPRRLNDIAMAPPTLPSMKRSTTKAVMGAFAPTTRTPLSAGQQRLMEEERERVIARYREMKEVKRVEREVEEKEKAKEKKAGGKGKGKSVVKKPVVEEDYRVEEVPME